jgi:hypothetical protein
MAKQLLEQPIENLDYAKLLEARKQLINYLVENQFYNNIKNKIDDENLTLLNFAIFFLPLAGLLGWFGHSAANHQTPSTTEIIVGFAILVSAVLLFALIKHTQNRIADVETAEIYLLNVQIRIQNHYHRRNQQQDPHYLTFRTKFEQSNRFIFNNYVVLLGKRAKL